MNHRIRVLLLLIGLLLLSYASTYAQEWNISDVSWEEMTEYNTSFPESIKVYYTNSTIIDDNDKVLKMEAWYASIDVSDENLIFESKIPDDNINKTTSSFVNSSDTYCYLGINGGYFGSGVSYSLVMNKGIELAENIRYLTRNNRGYWVTRGAFGIDSDKNMEVKWVFSDPSIETPWSYDIPAPNNPNEVAQQKPDANFPETAKLWQMKEAIGGAPVLIKNGVKISDYKAELLANSFDTAAHPRTAIGYTSDNKMILLVVDGRRISSSGLNLYTLADLMFQIGCVEAVNLDGGGSSTFVADYDVINRPSDGYERPVYSTFLVKDKSKTYLNSEKEIKKTSLVYPNPVKSDLIIERSNISSIKIVNAQGISIYQRLISPNQHNIKIDYNKVPDGLSILIINGEEGERESVKLIK